MAEIYFKNEAVRVTIEAGTTILQAARQSGVLLESPCDAIGTCGKCKVRLVNPEEARKKIQVAQIHHRLSDKEEGQGYVLACQAAVLEDITVETLHNGNQNKSLKILSEGLSFEYDIQPNITKIYRDNHTEIYSGILLIGKEEGDTRANSYGLVVDIGTTTLVAALVELNTGKELASVSALNPQSLKAQDVLTRINMGSNEEGLRQLYEVITEELNRMIEELTERTGILREHIYEVVYSGNTAMIHLATAVNPKPLGQYPYTPVIWGGNTIPAAGILNISPFGLIYLPPIISAYVGPDITSGVIASQLQHAQGTTLFVDIGTNGEMIMAKNGHLYATSTAAGPAFEGMNIEYGMRAGNGAIEEFSVTDDGRIHVDLIGDTKPIGICGSGLLDIVGELVRVKAIAANGKFASTKEEGAGLLPEYFIQRDGKTSVRIAGEVVLTQKDIRQVQLAKGAIRAGIEALLQKIGISADEVDRVEIAGSFGYHLKESSLLSIGMLPPVFKGRIHFVGNTSKSGGKAFLLNEVQRAIAAELVKKIGVVELANTEGFDKLFIKAMSF